jgi:hypothetical protein
MTLLKIRTSKDFEQQRLAVRRWVEEQLHATKKAP